jgi:hypothetical protein
VGEDQGLLIPDNPPAATDINVFNSTREISFGVRETSRRRERYKKEPPIRGSQMTLRKGSVADGDQLTDSPQTAESLFQVHRPKKQSSK